MLARIAAQVESQRRMISVRELYQGIDLRSRLKPAHLIAIAVEASLEHASPAAVFTPTTARQRPGACPFSGCRCGSSP